MIRAQLVYVLVVATFISIGAPSVGAQSTVVLMPRGNGVPSSNTLVSSSAWSAKWTPPDECTAGLTARDMEREEILLDARLAPNSDASLSTQSDLIAQEVAGELRVALGGSDRVVPNVGERIKWYSIPAQLIVTARPDRRMTWRGVSQSGDTGAVVLLGTALDSARKHGGAVMLWPDGLVADSIVFHLTLLPIDFAEASARDAKISKRLRFRVFDMLSPRESPAFPMRAHGDLIYPHSNQLLGVTGQLVAQFVVDTNGKAIISTFHDLWPADKPRLSGSYGRYYEQFLSSVRDYVADEQFTPAHIGSCTVRQIVQMPVEFQGPKGTRPYSQ
jgi:hypothetical protein